ncbi:MAG: flagellar biosynthesis anti-sigma factor FlgM [Betaproteobacteria bacterium]|nr:flagellar biosynthesis anti-sigma factor FlgM [Betaproteobacteria bacterium]
MKIDNSVKSVGGLAGANRGGAAKAGAARQPAAPESAGSDVALSPLSARLQQIEGSLASAPAVNSERVAEIRQAIAQGSFKIDPSKIADGLIDSVRLMLSAQK